MGPRGPQPGVVRRSKGWRRRRRPRGRFLPRISRTQPKRVDGPRAGQAVRKSSGTRRPRQSPRRQARQGRGPAIGDVSAAPILAHARWRPSRSPVCRCTVCFVGQKKLTRDCQSPRLCKTRRGGRPISASARDPFHTARAFRPRDVVAIIESSTSNRKQAACSGLDDVVADEASARAGVARIDNQFGVGT